MTQATIASKSHYCKLPLPLSLWEAVEWRWAAEMDGEREGGDRRGRCRGGSGCRERATVADVLPATSPSLLTLDSRCLAHTQTHVSKLIEASSLAPHQAQRVMTVTLFLHQPPTFIITHA